MSIASEITRINTNIANSYTAVDNKNGTLPQVQNSANLASAIDSIEVIEQATAEGESLSLANTKAMPYNDFVVEGKSEQDGEPSSSNPSEIHSVADDVNLFNINDMPISSNVSKEIKGNHLILTATGTAGAQIVGNYVKNLNSSKNYTLSFKAKKIVKGTNGEPYIRVALYGSNDDSSYSLFRYIDNTNPIQGQEYSFTSTFTGYKYYRIYFYNNTSTPVTIGEKTDYYDIKLQKGSTATPFSPYNQGTVTIKQRGKNLLDYGTKNFTTFYQEYGLNIPAGIYTFSAKVTSSDTSQNISRAYFYDSNGTSLGYVSLLRGSRSNETITLNGTAVRIVLYSSIDYSSSNGKEATYEDIQLEEGSTATSYEPYRANDYTIQTEPLRSLPNGVRDSLEADGIHRRVGRVVLDGSEGDWYKQDNTSYSQDYLRFTISITDKINAINPNSQKDNILSDKFTSKILDNNATRQSNSITGQYSTNLINIFIAQNIINGSRVEDFKTWLSNNPTELLYELEEETIEPLTQQQATTMLDIIKTGSYEGTTNIYTDEDVKPTIGVGYYKKG